ncbi:hypothetical protein Droror1_Dr00027492 [Drosera rotundifolia]
MPERNVYSWGAVIEVYSRKNRWKEVVGLFGMMVEEGILSSHFLVPKILKVCGNYEDYEIVRLVHSIVVRLLYPCVQRVDFGICQVWMVELGMGGFHEDDGQGRRELEFDYTSPPSHIHRIHAYTLRLTLDHDNLLLSNLKLGVVIGAYSRKNRWEEVVGLFGMMVEEGILPSHFLVPKILKACENYGDYEMVRLVHSIVVRCGFGCYTHVCNGLTSAYVRCG